MLTQPTKAASPAPAIYPVGYEQRTIETARRLLDDIPECSEAEYQVKFLVGSPVLIMSFPKFEVQVRAANGGTACPAFALRLVTLSQSEPLKPGRALEGDRLRRALRTNLETYMYRHGIRVPFDEAT